MIFFGRATNLSFFVRIARKLQPRLQDTHSDVLWNIFFDFIAVQSNQIWPKDMSYKFKNANKNQVQQG